MNRSYLIDTDWIIHYLAGNKKVVEKLLSLKEEGLAVCIVSIAELYEGVYYSADPIGNERALGDFLSTVSVLGVDEEICRIFGKERGRLRKRGEMVGDFDLLIASTCFCHSLTLLTNNRVHYKGVKGLNIISV